LLSKRDFFSSDIASCHFSYIILSLASFIVFSLKGSVADRVAPRNMKRN